MILLINKAEISKHRFLSKSLEEVAIRTFIDDAQNMDLAPLIGDAFLLDITKDQVKYKDLLEGSEFDNGQLISHVGLKKILSIFAYARYVMHGSKVDTPFGLVQKQNQESIAVSRDNKKEMYTNNRKSAFKYFVNIEKFIKKQKYPLYEGLQKKDFSFKFITI